jgi:hypothetical protein
MSKNKVTTAKTLPNKIQNKAVQIIIIKINLKLSLYLINYIRRPP